MSKDYGKLSRVSKEFDKWCDNVINKRFEKGIDNRKISRTDLTKAMMRRIDFYKLQESLMKPLKIKNNIGSIFDIFLFGIFALVIVMIIGVLLFIMYNMNLYMGQLPTLTINNEQINMSEFSEMSIGQVWIGGQSSLKFIAFVLIFGMIITMLLANYFIDAQPLWIIPYIIFVIVGVIMSAYIANAYETIVAIEPLGEYIKSLTLTDFFMTHLPYFTAVVGIIGIIILFYGIIKPASQEGFVPI